MLKILFLLPAILLACLIGSCVLLPLLALAPLLLVVALVLILPLLLLRVVLGVVLGLTGLVVAVLGVTLVIVGVSVLLAIGALAVHLALPVQLVVGLIWLIRRASRPAPLLLGHDPV